MGMIGFLAITGCQKIHENNYRNGMKIRIKTVTGKFYSLNVDEDESIENVKEKIHSETKIAVNRFSLSLVSGKKMDQGRLNDYKIEENTILMGEKTRFGLSIVTSDFTDSSKVRKTSVVNDPKIPDYRTVIPGFIVKGTCKNSDCNANKKLVNVLWGMGKFNINRLIHKCKCPSCKKRLSKDDIEAFGFYKTKYKYEGMLDGTDEEVTDSGKYDDDNSVSSFWKSDGELKWRWLEITTTKL